MSKKRKLGDVYNYFEHDDEVGKGLCNQEDCGELITWKSSNLKKHLEAKHPEVFRQLLGLEENQRETQEESGSIKRRKRGDVYYYFEHDSEIGKGLCNQEDCGELINWKSSNLKRHLDAKHPEVFKQLLDLEENQRETQEESGSIKRRKRGDVYYYFEHDSEIGKGLCNQEDCGELISWKSSNLKKHLEAKHPEVFRQLLGLEENQRETQEESGSIKRRKRGDVYNYFEHDSEIGKGLCNQEDCGELITWKSSNLKTHLDTKHPEVFKQLLDLEKSDPFQPSQAKSPTQWTISQEPSIKTFFKTESKTTILNYCVNLAINGKPFHLFDDPNMQAILQCALVNKGETGPISPVQVRLGVSEKAKELRQQIIRRLKGRRLSLSADFGNRNGVDFLGVMVQFQEEGKIVVLNLACRRLTGAHTAEDIKEWFKQTVEEFRIDEKQLLVFAIDSAANIQKAARDYLKELEEKFALDRGQIPGDNNDDNIVNIKVEFDPLSSVIQYDDLVSETDSDERLAPAVLATPFPQELVPTSYKIPCVSLQLQLALGKFSELPAISKMLETARRLSAKLRTPTFRNLLDQEKLPHCILDQVGWSSKAAMTTRLEELKEFCVRNQVLCIGLEVPDQFWVTLAKFNKLVEPFSILTTQLQSEQLTIPDFNKFWVTAMLSPAVNSEWAPAKKLKWLVNARRKKIEENPIIQAGIYLDPRFRSISLNGMSQNVAKQVIRAIFSRNLETVEPQPVKAADSDFEDEDGSDPLQAFLSSHFSSQQHSSQPQPLQQLEEQFRAYEKLNFDKRTIGKLDVVTFWREHAQSPASPLSKLASVALDVICAPVTKVTAERLFSYLNFVNNKHHLQLMKGDIVEDILFCRWNKLHES